MNNWTDHAPTENCGSDRPHRGQPYFIQMEISRTAAARRPRCRGAARAPKQIVPSSRLYPQAPSRIRINFQLAGAPIPAGYSRMRAAISSAAAADSVRMERRQRADARSQRGQVARSAVRHAGVYAAAGESRCGLGDCRPERNLTSSASISGDPRTSTAIVMENLDQRGSRVYMDQAQLKSGRKTDLFRKRFG